MRHIVLSDDGYHIAKDAYHRLMAACYFPESLRDQKQGLFVAALEREEFRRVGSDDYQPSEIALALSRLLEKRAAQHFAVGFIALCYIWLAKTRYRPSLNRASLIASYGIGEFGKVG